MQVGTFCSSKALWLYRGPTINDEHLDFAQKEAAKARAREIEQLEDEEAEAREQRKIVSRELRVSKRPNGRPLSTRPSSARSAYR